MAYPSRSTAPRRRHVEFALDRRQRDVHDAEVKDHHERGDEDQGELQGRRLAGAVDGGAVAGAAVTAGAVTAGAAGGAVAVVAGRDSRRLRGVAVGMIPIRYVTDRFEILEGRTGDEREYSGGGELARPKRRGAAGAAAQPGGGPRDLDGAAELLADRGLSRCRSRRWPPAPGSARPPSTGAGRPRACCAGCVRHLVPRSAAAERHRDAARRPARRAARVGSCRDADPDGPMLTSLIAEAQHDPNYAGRAGSGARATARSASVMLDRAVERGEIPVSVDPDVVLDLFFGAAEHRLLLGHLPMTTPSSTRSWT